MASVLIGKGSSVIMGGDIIKDFGSGDVIKLTVPNEFVELETGKGGNTFYVWKEKGSNIDCEMRVLVGSTDDIRINSRITNMTENFVGTVLMDGIITRPYSNGDGVIKYQQFFCKGGSYVKGAEFVDNTDGSAEQAINVYKIRFATYKVKYL